MKNMTFSTILSVLLIVACGSAVLAPGNRVDSELPPPDHSLECLWPGAEARLLESGYPVRGDWYADVYKLSGEGFIGYHASSSIFTPVLAAVDCDGNLIACSDTWKGTDDAWIVLEDVPDGSRLLVFSLDDRRGEYNLECRSASVEEFDDFIFFTNLDSGTVFGTLTEGREYRELESVLLSGFGDILYSDNPQIARLHPFFLDSDGVLSLTLVSDDFDAILFLVQADGGGYTYIADNDDADDLNSRIDSWLSAGEYIAIALSYDSLGGEYTLGTEFIPVDQLTYETVEVMEAGIEYMADITAGVNLAITIWSDMVEEEVFESYLEPSDPTAAFSFTVDESFFYTLTAISDMDICLTLLKKNGEEYDFLAFNDDSPDMGTNSSITSILPKGDYMALISSYYQGEKGTVTFSFTEDDRTLQVLKPGRSETVNISYNEPEAYFTFEADAYWEYTLTAEDVDLDPMIELYMPDGTVFSDDDSGDDLNSLLSIVPSEAQAGRCILKVTTYWDDSEGSITVRLEKERFVMVR